MACNHDVGGSIPLTSTFMPLVQVHSDSRSLVADQKRWFKVWTSILSDDDFDCGTQEGRDRLARFVWLGAYSALHGNSGAMNVDKPFLLSRLGVTDLSRLGVTLACKNVTFEEGKNRHGKLSVTIAKWVKYQEDSTQAERQKASRAKRRREERREEEIRGEIVEKTKSDSFSVTDLVNSWNEWFEGKLSKVQLPLSKSRLRKANLRLKEHPSVEFWKTVFEQINKSQFLLGSINSKGHDNWRCTFDFIIDNDSNCVKIAEGNYGKDP